MLYKAYSYRMTCINALPQEMMLREICTISKSMGSATACYSYAPNYY